MASSVKCLAICASSHPLVIVVSADEFQKVTASIYTDQLEKLAAAIREKRPRRASVHLLHDNARPHVAKETQKKLATLGWETLLPESPLTCVKTAHGDAMELESCDPNQVYGRTVPICAEPHTVFDHYTNVCVPAALIQFEDQENEFKMIFIYSYVLPLLAIAVVVSNSIVIVVLSQQKSKRASSEALLFMAISSMLMAISPLPFTVYYYSLSHYRDVNQTLFLCHLQKYCMEILPFFFNTLITLFTLLLGVQRFIAVQYPLESFRWCTQKMIRRYSKLILLFAVLLSAAHSIYDIRLIYHFCILMGDESFWVARCFIGHSALTTAVGPQTFASISDYFRIALVVIPSVLLFIVTILLIQTIQTGHVDKAGVHRQKPIQKSSQNTTTMLTVIIILFMLARTPSTVLIILVRYVDYLPVPTATFDFVHDVYLRVCVNILSITLHPISFAVYMFMSRRFRVSLRRLFGWRCLASDDEFNAFTSSMRMTPLKRTELNRRNTCAQMPMPDSWPRRQREHDDAKQLATP